MVTIVKKVPSKEELNTIFRSVETRKKGVDVRKYAGKVKAKGQPVKLQQKLRNEWQKSPS